MKRAALTAALALLSLDAMAVGRSVDVSILDRDSGRVLPTYYYRGEYWVAGTPGARYGVTVQNRSGERLLAVMAVDGVNVVTGETAGWTQSGYVFDARQSYDITGWRKSNSEVAAFLFAAAPDSYAARTGRAANVGVIGVALFREQAPPLPPPLAMNAPRPSTPSDATYAASAGRQAGAPVLQESAKSEPEGRSNTFTDRLAPSLGTAHGRREDSRVVDTEFERRQSTPDEIIRIRYDSLDNLLAMGVIRRPPHGPNAFPDSGSQGFVADPPGYSAGSLR